VSASGHKNFADNMRAIKSETKKCFFFFGSVHILVNVASALNVKFRYCHMVGPPYFRF
jgi:hypothetical protein